MISNSHIDKNNNSNNKIHFLNLVSGTLLFLTSVYGFMDIHDDFHFTNLVVNLYTIFASFGVVFVSIAGCRGQNPPGILDYFTNHNRQLTFLFFYSWLTIGVSFTSQVLGILVLIYSFLGLCYFRIVEQEQDQRVVTANSENIGMNSVV